MSDRKAANVRAAVADLYRDALGASDGRRPTPGDFSERVDAIYTAARLAAQRVPVTVAAAAGHGDGPAVD